MTRSISAGDSRLNLRTPSASLGLSERLEKRMGVADRVVKDGRGKQADLVEVHVLAGGGQSFNFCNPFGDRLVFNQRFPLPVVPD
jgi:hypothetical protein